MINRSYLTRKTLNLRKIDELRYREIQKNNFIDEWSRYAFHDIQESKDYQSQSGNYYTPEWLISFMVESTLRKWILDNSLNDLWNAKILEPSCGSGNFVEILFFQIENYFTYNYPLKSLKEIREHIATYILYAYDINENAIEKTRKRVLGRFGVHLRNCSVSNTFLRKTAFDIIISHPPYGNPVIQKETQKIRSEYGNITLSFLNWSQKHLTEKGCCCFIIAHDFSRLTGGAKRWRQQLMDSQSLYSIIDVGFPFNGIQLEQIIVTLTKKKNHKIRRASIRENQRGTTLANKNFFIGEDKTMNLYGDQFYEAMKEGAESFPFSGISGLAVRPSGLLSNRSNNTETRWLIQSRNIGKGHLIAIPKQDKYVPLDIINRTFGEKLTVACLNNGELSATQIDTVEACPSGNVLIIGHENLSHQETVEYLNQEVIQYFVKRYLLNNSSSAKAKLEGKHLKLIPYLKQERLDEIRSFFSL